MRVGGGGSRWGIEKLMFGVNEVNTGLQQRE